MRLPCWLVGHRRIHELQFVRRLDGYPVAAYDACRNCDKRLGLTWCKGEPAPFNADLAAELARPDEISLGVWAGGSHKWPTMFCEGDGDS